MHPLIDNLPRHRKGVKGLKREKGKVDTKEKFGGKEKTKKQCSSNTNNSHSAEMCYMMFEEDSSGEEGPRIIDVDEGSEESESSTDSNQQEYHQNMRT